jgi:hypothetical protein
VADRLKNYHTNPQITAYLQSEGIAETEFSAILEAAHARLQEEKLAYFGKRNKRMFFIWLAAASLILVLYLFILPHAHIAGYETFLGILGTALFCLFCFLAMAYNKSWEPASIERQEKPKIDFGFMAIFLIPAVIVYFLFSWRISSGQDMLLKQSQERATGRIISGKSTSVTRLRGGSAEFSEVTVAFVTKNGKNITATEDISSYEFKNFYKDQEVELIYSKDDPQNIDLLTNASSIKEFIGSEERDLTAEDLLGLMNERRQTVLGKLNHISFGWQYRSADSAWINEKKELAIAIKDNELMCISGYIAMIKYPKQLLALGFVQTSEQQGGAAAMVGNKEFKNEQYNISISVSRDGEQKVMTMITKK